MTIVVPNELDNVFRIDEFNQKVYAVMQNSSKNEITVDFNGLKFISPLGMVSLLLGLNSLSNTKNILLCIDDFESNVVSYLERLNFFKLLPNDLKNSFSDKLDLEKLEARCRNYKSFTLLELMPLNDYPDVDTMCDCIYNICINKKLGTKITTNITNITTELATNIIDHSDGQGYVTVQFYPSINTIRIGIADNGIGIVNRYKQKVPHLSNQQEILKQAFMDGNTTRVISAGRGLQNVRSHSFNESIADSIIHLKTGNNIYDIQKKEISVLRTTSHYLGTYFDFKIQIA